MNVNEMMPTNFMEALQFCERMLNKILDFPLKTSRQGNEFPKEIIDSLREIADCDSYDRKKKDVGVIGGSVGGITGSAMSIVGAVLAPVTGGLSLALLVSGGILALGGAGTNIGFIVTHHFSSKKRQEKVRPTFEMYIEFHKHFVGATVEIHGLLNFIRETMRRTLHTKALFPEQTEIITNIDREVKRLYELGEQEAKVPEKLRHLSNCVDNIHEEMGELIRYMVSLEELRDFPKTWKERQQEELRRRANGVKGNGNKALEHLRQVIPERKEEPLDEGDYTFREFVRRYVVDVDIDDSTKLSNTMGVSSGKVASKLGAGGTGIGAGVVKGTLQVSDDVARGSTFIAKILNGLSAASVVLSGIGIAFDVGFLAFAAHDLSKTLSNEEKRMRGEDIQSVSFSDQLRDLAESMDRINKVTTGHM